MRRSRSTLSAATPDAPDVADSQLERSLTTEQLGMPLVHRVGVIQSQQASRITWHVHEYFEMLFLLEGATSYEFEETGTLELSGGHFLLIPPGVRHRGLYEVRHPVRLCGVMFHPKNRRALDKTPFTRENLSWIHDQCEIGALKVCRMNHELRHLIRMLSHLMSSDALPSADPLFLPTLRTNLCAILLESSRQITARRISKTSLTVEAAQHFMEKHLSSFISMDDVAAAANCSRARLFAVFKDSTGMTPNHFLLRLRINQAQLELTHTSKSITAIAFDSGFSTSQYFSMVFRKYTGSTPLEFRRRQGT